MKNCRTKEGLKTIIVSHGTGKASQHGRGLKNHQRKPRTVSIKVAKKERSPALRGHALGTCVKNVCYGCVLIVLARKRRKKTLGH